MSEQECIFCKIIKGEIPCEKVYESSNVFAFHDIEPQAPDHILIVSKKHIPTVSALEEEDAAMCGEMMIAAKKIAKLRQVPEDSFRLIVNNGTLALQSVFHLHVHFLAGREMKWPPG